jgi:hypothetical protein
MDQTANVRTVDKKMGVEGGDYKKPCIFVGIIKP